ALEEDLIDPSRSIQVGMRGPLYDASDLTEAEQLGLEMITYPEVQALSMDDVAARVKRRVGDGPTFLSFDIDFLDPSCAPGTGTPEIGGPLTREALQLVRGLTGIRFVGFDLVEVLPQYDIAELTAMTAANVIYEFLSLLALQRQESSDE
ncbi:MAG TPA: arginase family protein, partial [Chloroflexota bacterium]